MTDYRECGDDAGDEQLREMFFGLRREEEANAPRFMAGSGVRKEPAGLWLKARLAGLAVCAAVIAGVALWVWPGDRGSAAPDRRAGVPVASITAWRPPTDFLLETPGRALLVTTPAIGAKGYAGFVPGLGPVQTRKDAQLRRRVSP